MQPVSQKAELPTGSLGLGIKRLSTTRQSYRPSTARRYCRCLLGRPVSRLADRGARRESHKRRIVADLDQTNIVHLHGDSWWPDLNREAGVRGEVDLLRDF